MSYEVAEEQSDWSRSAILEFLRESERSEICEQAEYASGVLLTVSIEGGPVSGLDETNPMERNTQPCLVFQHGKFGLTERFAPSPARF